MSLQGGIAICKDQHRCLNGGKCVENLHDEGTYYCDCSLAGDDSIAYEGLYCEHKATEYCSDSSPKVSFCTNFASCLPGGRKKDIHFGCRCLDGYKGDHCQFSSSHVPDNWPTLKLAESTANTNSNGRGPKAVAFISVLAIAMAMVIGFFAFRRYSTRQESDAKTEEPVPELTMAGSSDAGASLPHPDEVRQHVAEDGLSPRKTRAEPNAVMEGEDADVSNLEDVNMGRDII